MEINRTPLLWHSRRNRINLQTPENMAEEIKHGTTESEAVDQQQACSPSCRRCGTAFERKCHLQVFCSDACRKAATNERRLAPWVTKRCVVCNHEFRTNTAVKICCSAACARERTYQARAVVNPALRNGSEIKCKSCGESFVKEHQNQKYCSRECQRGTPHYPPRNCGICGRLFTPHRRDAQTCGVECRMKREAGYTLKKRVLEHNALRAVFGDDHF